MYRMSVAKAIYSRNFWSYFSGVIGYLFIVVFVILGAYLAFRQEFFTNNLANLDQLNQYFPQLLLFIIPAITMGVWSEEKKLGTDELLFTLPVSDFEVLIGKYKAVVGVYSVVLAFSLMHCVILFLIGAPDPWVLLANYLGYWLAGAALLSAGMVASYLTNNSTVAFVLGAILCLVPVFIGYVPVPGFLANWTNNELLFEQLSVPYHLRPFGMGLVPVSSVLYFVSFAALMLYVNRVLMGHRHWSGGKNGRGMTWQFVVRSVSLAVILISVNAILSNFNYRFDFTSERVYTLTPTTHRLLGEITDKRPVTIQAFVSRNVPREYVPVKTSLLGMLGQYEQEGRGNVTVRVVTVDPFSDEAEQAKASGLQPRRVQSERGGRIQTDDIYLGAVVNSGSSEVVVPFFDVALPTEYELSRSVRTVANEKRLTVGILETDAKIGGGMDMGTFRRLPEWQIVQELKKQYTVETVSASAPIDEKKYDVLVAVLPSSLGVPEMRNFVDYVRKGRPTLIFDDPLPATNPELAPSQPKPRAGGMMGMMGQQPPEPKADGGKATSLVNLLQIEWVNDEVVFDNTIRLLHPEISDIVRPEMISVSPQSGNKKAFNAADEVTDGLQEMLLFFSGTIRPRKGTPWKFEPLLQTGADSGLIEWQDLVEQGMMGGLEIVEDPPLKTDIYSHYLAARITSPDQPSGDKAGGDKVNVIYVADVDMIADWFFSVRERQLFGLNLDNIPFILNAVDSLAGDKSYIPLRKRRQKHRTLTAVELAKSRFIKERGDAQQKANDEARTALEEAKKRLKAQVEAVAADKSLDDMAKLQMRAIAAQNESRRLAVAQANIDQSKQKQIDAIKSKAERQIRSVEDRFFWQAFILSPIPPIVVGLIFLLTRLRNERMDIAPSRRVDAR